jgi:transcriptional regulator with XRE-family HTH domain
MTRKPLALALRLYREAAKITQTELAKRCGIARPHINAMESGARNPTAEHLEKIARGYEVDSTVFLARACAMAAAHVAGNDVDITTTPETKHDPRKKSERCRTCGFRPCYCGARAINPFGPYDRADDLPF